MNFVVQGKPWRLQPKEAAVVLFAWNTICFWRELPGGSRANEWQEITSCPSLGFYLFSSQALPPSGLLVLLG